MKANSMNADQTAPLGSSLIWIHVVCGVGYESTPVDEKADNIYHKWRENDENDTKSKGAAILVIIVLLASMK